MNNISDLMRRYTNWVELQALPIAMFLGLWTIVFPTLLLVFGLPVFLMLCIYSWLFN